MKRMKIIQVDGAKGIPSKNGIYNSKMYGQENYLHPISGFGDYTYPADMRSRDAGKTGIKKLYIVILVIAVALVIATIFLFKGMNQTSEADKLRKFLEAEDSYGTKNGNKISEVYDPYDTKTWSGVEWLGNQVTSIDWGRYHIEDYSDGGYLVGELDLSNFDKLTTIDIDYNKISKFNCSGCVSLENFWCSSGEETKSVDLSNCKYLKSLSLDEHWRLEELKITNCTALEELSVSNSKIKGLDLTGCISLKWLWVVNGELETLDVRPCEKVEILWCYGNKLSMLNVSGCSALNDIKCQENYLSTLDVSDCKNLSSLQCDDFVVVHGLGSDIKVKRYQESSYSEHSKDPTSSPTPTPAPTPQGPSLIDINGCDERVVVPDYDSWLPEYVTKYVKSQKGNCIILRLEPVEYYEDGGENYLDRVWEKTEVTELARQNGFSLIKTAAGQVGWVKSHLIVSENVVGDISWNYNETTKTLTISGSGLMDISFWSDTFWSGEFAKFEKLVITDGITSICSSAFKDNYQLREVYLPDSLVAIDQYAFSECNSITEIHLPSNLKTLGVGAFQGCSSLKKINLPKSLLGPTLSQSLSDTDITPGIAFNLFERCSSLEKIGIPSDAKNIGQSAFVNCRGLTEITIPDGVKTIGIYTFMDCAGLTELYIPASVNWIDCGAFEGCSNLRTIYLAGYVETFVHPFDECPNLKDIYFGGTQEQWNEMQEYCPDDWLSGVTVHFDSM